MEETDRQPKIVRSKRKGIKKWKVANKGKVGKQDAGKTEKM